jgi:hypothetical protein
VDATDRQPTVHGPDGQPVQMISGQWQERQVYLSEEPIRNAGVYRAQIPGREPLHYGAALPPEESRLELIDEGERALALGRARPIVVEEEGRLADLVDPGSSHTEELWRKLLLGAVLMLFVESLITRHQAVTDRGRLSVAEG